MKSSRQEYLEGMIRHLRGIADLIKDPAITDIHYNSTSDEVFLDGANVPDTAGFLYPEEAALNFLRVTATYFETQINERVPRISVRLPEALGSCRLQGYVPPISKGVRFTLRKPGRVFPLSDYVDDQVGQLLKEALKQKKNILLAGSTGAGKTSFLNAMIAELSRLCPKDRLIILEDTPELQCSQANHGYLFTVRDREGNEIISMADNVFNALRDDPTRIILGEVRDNAARAALKAWRSGHPGFCTFHADDAENGFWQFFHLAELKYSERLDQITTANAIDYIFYLSKENGKRKVRQVVSPWYDHSSGAHGQVRFQHIYPENQKE